MDPYLVAAALLAVCSISLLVGHAAGYDRGIRYMQRLMKEHDEQ